MDKLGEALDTRAASLRYRRDLYTWAVEQAALLRAGRLDEADVLNIADELDDVAERQYSRLEESLRRILLYLLKWDHDPARRSSHWTAKIRLERGRAARALRKNPGLGPQIEEAIVDAYDIARVEAAAHLDCDEGTFPVECPYTWADIMERDIPWPAEE